MSDRDARIESLLQALRTIEGGELPDGDGVNVPTALFAERVLAEDAALAAADAVQGDDTDWRCECGDLNRDHEAFCYRCGAGQPEQAGDGKRMVDLIVEALDDVASKVLPGSDPMACVRAAAGVIEREFGGSAPSEGRR